MRIPPKGGNFPTPGICCEEENNCYYFAPDACAPCRGASRRSPSTSTPRSSPQMLQVVRREARDGLELELMGARSGRDRRGVLCVRVPSPPRPARGPGPAKPAARAPLRGQLQDPGGSRPAPSADGPPPRPPRGAASRCPGARGRDPGARVGEWGGLRRDSRRVSWGFLFF